MSIMMWYNGNIRLNLRLSKEIPGLGGFTSGQCSRICAALLILSAAGS